MEREIKETWFCTKSKVVKVNFKWTIDKFSLYKAKNLSLRKGVAVSEREALTSASFSSEWLDGTKWRLILYPVGECPILTNFFNQRKFVSIYLLSDSLDTDFQVSFSVELQSKAGCKPSFSVKQERNEAFSKYSNKHGWTNFVEWDRIFTSDLILVCDLKYILAYWNTSYTFQDVSPVCHGNRTLKSVFEDKTLADVTFVAEGRQIKAHKAILAHQSPVFKAMFGHGMLENITNRVDVSDVDFDVLNELLLFIYCGHSDKIKELAKNLLIAADKYAVDRLKLLCQEQLCRELTAANAAELLILAELHTCVQLKKSCINYITGHITDVMKSEGWKALVEKHPFVTVVLKTLAD